MFVLMYILPAYLIGVLVGHLITEAVCNKHAVKERHAAQDEAYRVGFANAQAAAISQAQDAYYNVNK